MANNEVSGIALVTHLAEWAGQRPRRNTYRFIFVPETIGAIVFLSRRLEHLKRVTRAGFQVTCVGDERCTSFLPSRRGGTLADRCAAHVLNYHATNVKWYSFLDRGSDERQYCSPGVDLPVVSIMRSKYGTYPEYHTSLDDLSLVSAEGLGGSFELYVRCFELLEANRTYIAATPCEPQLSRRGLYPVLGTHDGAPSTKTLLDFLAYCDGDHDLIAIADLLGVAADQLVPIAETLLSHGLIKAADIQPEENR